MNKDKKKSRFSLNKSLSMSEQLTIFNSSFSHPINEEKQYDEEDGQIKEVKREVGIFEEFKIKYDELRKENQQKRNQIDQLKRMNKRLQIQLLNINTEFYDKEIKRLRAEVEKHQQEAQDFKFKYFEVQNKRKQLQSSLGISEKEMTKLIKQLQSQKVQNVQLKYQIKQNQKQYLKIISTVEESNNKTAQRYTECESKLRQVQNELKKAKTDCQQERKNYEKLEKSKKETEQDNKKVIQKYQIQIKNIKKQLQDCENQSMQYRKQISLLKQKLSQVTLELNKSKSLIDFQANKNYQKINQFKSTRIMQIQNKKFKQENQILKKQVENKTRALTILQNRLNQAQKQLQLQRKQYERNLIDLKHKKAAIQKSYESKNISLSKEIEKLKIQCIKSEQKKQNLSDLQSYRSLSQSVQLPKNSQNSSKRSQQNSNPMILFQNEIEQVLKSRQTEIMQLKNILNEKIEQIFKLKQQLEDIQISSQNMRSEILILEKKLSVQQRNLSSRNQIDFLEMKSQIQSLKRKLALSQSKVQVKSKQIKQKDSFILSSIIGRIQKQQDIPLVMAQMQRVFQSGYIQKLVDAQNKIKSLEAKIVVK